ncbi:MAG: hypothetical protein ACTSXZ_05580 [Alphaproteobacteria bacterium]
MKSGTIDDIRRAANLIEKCEVENTRTQSELTDMARRLQELATDLTAVVVVRGTVAV